MDKKFNIDKFVNNFVPYNKGVYYGMSRSDVIKRVNACSTLRDLAMDLLDHSPIYYEAIRTRIAPDKKGVIADTISTLEYYMED